MSLPSQGGIGFGGATRARSRRGRGGGGGRKALIAVVVLALAGGLVWAFTPGDKPGAKDGPAGASELAQSASRSGTSPEAPKPREAQQPDSRLVSVPPAEPQARSEQPKADPPNTELADTQQGAGVLATPAAPEQAALSPAGSGRSSAAVATLVERAEQALKANNPVAAREHFNEALMNERASASDRATIRQRMQELNQDLVFSPRVYPDDPFTTVYTVQANDNLGKIAQSEGVATEWKLIQRVNRLSNPHSIYEGQKLKLVHGPFHAVVSKSAFRMDVYVGPPGETEQWMYVRSFPVGLGESDGTPVGAFTVRRHSKLVNPFWRNPRTGEEFAADDPKNPIGDHWIGLRGLGQAETYSGYGIHGTIDPGSIGRSMSMGCVRMLPEDVALVYELLTEEISRVHIVE